MRVSIASPHVLPSPNGRRVGIRIVTFEACSDFTRVTARRIAQPPKATFVARLQPSQLPDQTARQLPDLSTIIRARPSLTDGSRLRGALPEADIFSLKLELVADVAGNEAKLLIEAVGIGPAFVSSELHEATTAGTALSDRPCEHALAQS